MQNYDSAHQKGVSIFLVLILSRLMRFPRFVWSPALDFGDRSIYSTLIPGAHS